MATATSPEGHPPAAPPGRSPKRPRGRRSGFDFRHALSEARSVGLVSLRYGGSDTVERRCDGQCPPRSAGTGRKGASYAGGA